MANGTSRKSASSSTPDVEDLLAAKVFYTGLKSDGYLTRQGTGNNMPTQDYENYGVTFLMTPSEDSSMRCFTIEKFKDNSQGGGSLTNFNLGRALRNTAAGFARDWIFPAGSSPARCSPLPMSFRTFRFRSGTPRCHAGPA